MYKATINQIITRRKLLIILMVVVITILISRLSLSHPTQENSPTQSTPGKNNGTNEAKTPGSIESSRLFSPDDKKWAYLQYLNSSTTHTLNLICSVPLKTIYPENPFICFRKEWRSKDWLFGNYVPIIDEIAWSSLSDKLAIVIPGYIEIFYIEKYVEKIESVNYERFKETKHLEIKRNSQTTGHVNLFFSGDGKELYLNQEIPEKIDLTDDNPQLTPVPVGRLGIGIYPIPGSSGYVTWGENPYPKLNVIELRQNGEISKHNVDQMDYLGKIVLSPDSRKVCAEAGSSGYWGYRIYNLVTDTAISVGPEYSHCVRWLDNNRIIIKEAVYNFSQGSPHYYLFNTLTDNKELLFIGPVDTIKEQGD